MSSMATLGFWYPNLNSSREMQSHNDVSSEDDILSGLTSFEHAAMCFDAIWVFLFDQDMCAHLCFGKIQMIW